MSINIHIITSGITCPADCGNAIDKLQQINMLHQLGCTIYLHYFSEKDDCIPNELNGYCQKVYRYLTLADKTAATQELALNIQKDTYPLLIQDAQQISLLSGINVDNRKVVIRVANRINAHCNVKETSFFSSIKNIISGKSGLAANSLLSNQHTYACISAETVNNLKEKFSLNNAMVLPIFSNWQKVSGEEGMGGFCLYHGNLSLPENEKAAIWLINNVFNKIRNPLIIAGKNPSKKLEKIATLCNNHCLVANPSEAEMNDLVQKAHIHVLPCFNEEHSGVSLKLLHALYEGRHCIVNEQMVKNSKLESACHIASTADAFASIIMQLYHQPFTKEEITLRKHLLEETYDNKTNALKLMKWLS